MNRTLLCPLRCVFMGTWSYVDPSCWAFVIIKYLSTLALQHIQAWRYSNLLNYWTDPVVHSTNRLGIIALAVPQLFCRFQLVIIFSCLWPKGYAKSNFIFLLVRTDFVSRGVKFFLQLTLFVLYIGSRRRHRRTHLVTQSSQPRNTVYIWHQFRIQENH